MAKLIHFGSHLPLLVKCLSLTSGSVLEMGMGYCSTPILHWLCVSKQRPLVSYDNDPQYFSVWKSFARDSHQLVLVEDWAKADIEKDWDVVLVDHKPAIRRKDDVKRLANRAKFIILHDSEGRHDNEYHYSEIYSLFRWKYVYAKYFPQSVLLSNQVDLTEFSV